MMQADILCFNTYNTPKGIIGAKIITHNFGPGQAVETKTLWCVGSKICARLVLVLCYTVFTATGEHRWLPRPLPTTTKLWT